MKQSLFWNGVKVELSWVVSENRKPEKKTYIAVDIESSSDSENVGYDGVNA